MTMPFWTPAGLSGRVGVSDITLRRWKRSRRLPPWAAILIRLLDGELDAIDPAWRGWIIRRGELVSPENWCFRPGEVRSIPLMHASLAAYRSPMRVTEWPSGTYENGRFFGAAANDDAFSEPWLTPNSQVEGERRPSAQSSRRETRFSRDVRPQRTPPKAAAPATMGPTMAAAIASTSSGLTYFAPG